MNKLYIKNETNFRFCYSFLFWRIINFVCKKEKIKGRSEVNLIIVCNDKIKKIADQYQYKSATIPDVLSFPSDYKQSFKILRYNMLGDIYMSYQKINEQAIQYNHSQKREWAYMFTHSLYHLLGYDHINDSLATNIMNNKVAAIMKKMKIGRND